MILVNYKLHVYGIFVGFLACYNIRTEKVQADRLYLRMYLI